MDNPVKAALIFLGSAIVGACIASSGQPISGRRTVRLLRRRRISRNPFGESYQGAQFRAELANLINRYSLENGSDTPDFILASYLQGCLDNFDHAVTTRSKWYAPCANAPEPEPSTPAEKSANE